MTHPTPPWAVLREHAPEILDDFVDLWARLDTLNPQGREVRELRWLVEHLAALVEDHLATHHDLGCYFDDYAPDQDDTGADDDDVIGLVTP